MTIDSMSCEVISSSHSAAHAARQKDDCTVVLLPITLLAFYILVLVKCILETAFQDQVR